MDRKHFDLQRDADWWRGAVVYQIYPRSFQDSDADGVGDLPGLLSRLDYVASLGVDAIWISPFFTSPMRDFGYDVSDYRDVDPIFGTLADFDAIVARAHELGLKVIIDQVYAHVSDQHPWFADSRNRHDKTDWFVWADPKPDGSPPNNWQSVFGGPAWTWDARRCQYYLHTFLREQPQLNLHNPQVRTAVLDVARFWLDRGVDGFRLDALNHSHHDLLLRDNPPRTDDLGTRSRPFDYQDRIYSESRPEAVSFIEQLRAVCDEYGAIHTVAEVGGDADGAVRRAYTGGKHRLDSAYGFDFLYADRLDPAFVAKALTAWTEDAGWPSWAFENHDSPRAISRWASPADRERFAAVKLALLLSLRGNPIVYQGQELGLEQDDIAFEDLRDPEAIANWPLTLSRDGARTPIPWRNEPGGGFTLGTPWLPFSQTNLAKSVAVQEGADGSLLSLTRDLLATRRSQPPLRTGTLDIVVCDDALLGFVRREGVQAVLCLFNLGGEERGYPEAPIPAAILSSINGATTERLPGYSGLLGELRLPHDAIPGPECIRQ